MAETTYFESGDVKVTNARFISGAQTFAMNNVTSVKPFIEQPKRFWPIVTIIIGFIVAANSIGVGLAILVVGAIVLYIQKTKYFVLLATSGGDTKALMTHDRAYLNSVMQALNEAIIHRG